MALEVGDRVRVASQNSQFRGIQGEIVSIDETHYTDYHDNALPTVGDPFYVVQPDGASPVMTARFVATDLVAID